MESELRELGLGDHESKAYFALLKSGPSSAYKVSKLADLYKANTYDVLKKLEKRGLVSSFKKGSTTIYQTTDLSNLQGMLVARERKFAEMLPKLKMFESLASDKSDISMTKGLSNFINTMHALLERGEPILVFGLPGSTPKMLGRLFESFHKTRVKKKIKMYHVYSKSAKKRIDFLNSLPYTYASYLDESMASDVSTNVCGDEVLLVIWLEGNVKSVLIRDADVARSYRENFRFLWKHAKHNLPKKAPKP